MNNKLYTVYYGDNFYKFAQNKFFVAEIKNDDTIIDVDYNVDITEYANYSSPKGYEDFTTPSYTKALKLVEKLNK